MAPKEADLLAQGGDRPASAGPRRISDDQLTRTELAMKLKQRKPVGSDQIDKTDEPPVDAADQEHAEAVARIKKMAFGTWFEFDDPGARLPVRRKMAWFSTQHRSLPVRQPTRRAHA